MFEKATALPLRVATHFFRYRTNLSVATSDRGSIGRPSQARAGTLLTLIGDDKGGFCRSRRRRSASDWQSGCTQPSPGPLRTDDPERALVIQREAFSAETAMQRTHINSASWPGLPRP